MNRVSSERPKVGVGVAVVSEGKVLLGKRKGAHGAGCWSFAGGHLEFGETVEECAKREVLEETGLIAHSVILGPWTNDVIEETKHYITLFVFVDQFIGELELREPHKCEGWQWFPWKQLPTPLFPPIVNLIAKVGLEYLEAIIFSGTKKSD
jgi:8-oxo-dGTP diphosphatase